MRNYTTEAGVAKASLLRFCKKICSGLGRVQTKLVTAMIYGIAASESCHLTEIGRALDEGIGIKKTVDRLSRGLQSFSHRAVLWANYLKCVDKYVDETTIFPIDLSDMAKPYSRKMEAMHPVHDGSTGKNVPGYSTIEITALAHKFKTPLPVYERVFSAAEPGFVSETEEICNGLRFLTARYGRDGIRVVDRGFDANGYIEYFFETKEKFILRTKKNRIVWYKNESVNIEELAGRFKGKYAFKCKIQGKTVHCKIAEIHIQIPAFQQHALNLVVVYGFGETPMLLLTNCHSDDRRFCAVIAKMYLLRWRIEDHFRFKKQQFNLEDFRVRSLAAIRTLHLLVTLLTGYLALQSLDPLSVITCTLRQAAKPIKRAKNRTPKRFFHYELSVGLAFLLAKTTANLKRHFPPLRYRPPAFQLSLLSLKQLADLAT